MYGISAEELHNNVVSELKRLCKYHKVKVMEETFAEADKRPLIETISLVMYEYHASMLERHDFIYKD